MLSVIIPTYNRLDKLKKTLAAFGEQTLAKQFFEVIVVDDGSLDGTKDFMEEFVQKTELNLKYFSLEHHGAGSARNFGLERAEGEIIFFCGDDTRPEKDLLKIHYWQHEVSDNVAVLGLALWDESQRISEFMHYLAPNGPQFHYGTIQDKQSAGFSHFYTCNISLDKKWLADEKFDEKFIFGFEDIELGMRLENKGLKIVYDPRAKVYHDHYYDEESFVKRMRMIGCGAVQFMDKYKNDKKSLNKFKKKYAPFCFFPGIRLFFRISRILANSKLLKKINKRYYWFWLVCWEYSAGMLEKLR
jgi:glycosyltransferase involved in cell wall biosynthesis